jgi:peroxiredoxin Q/BCP
MVQKTKVALVAACAVAAQAWGCGKQSASPSGQAPAALAKPADTPPPATAAVPPQGAKASGPRTELLREGEPVPNIEAVAHNGETVKLADYRGRPVVVYFYPKDDTTGCTIEAKEIRDLWADLSETRAVVIGVSTDDNDSHRAFANKYELPFLLLPDQKQEIAGAFGVPVRGGVASRITFVIDGDGKVKKVFPNVSPKGHGAEVLAAVNSIGG